MLHAAVARRLGKHYAGQHDQLAHGRRMGGQHHHVVTEANPDDATVLLTQGLNPDFKPALAFVGGPYAPGRGVERAGTYVARPDAFARGSFGKVRLHLALEPEELAASPELVELGHSAQEVDYALGNEGGAVTTRAIPPEAITQVEWWDYASKQWLSDTRLGYLKRMGLDDVPRLPSLAEYRAVLEANAQEWFLDAEDIEQQLRRYRNSRLRDKLDLAEEVWSWQRTHKHYPGGQQHDQQAHGHRGRFPLGDPSNLDPNPAPVLAPEFVPYRGRKPWDTDPIPPPARAAAVDAVLEKLGVHMPVKIFDTPGWKQRIGNGLEIEVSGYADGVGVGLFETAFEHGAYSLNKVLSHEVMHNLWGRVLDTYRAESQQHLGRPDHRPVLDQSLSASVLETIQDRAQVMLVMSRLAPFLEDRAFVDKLLESGEKVSGYAAHYWRRQGGAYPEGLERAISEGLAEMAVQYTTDMEAFMQQPYEWRKLLVEALRAYADLAEHD